MKSARHEKILELIEERPITTQEELLSRLKQSGIPVTQATISRDIKHLRLVKTLNENGIYCYTVLENAPVSNLSDKFFSIFRETVLAVDCAGHIVCVKCYTGMANAACAALDTMKFEHVVGTLSGDDTFFVLMRNQADAGALRDTLAGFVGK